MPQPGTDPGTCVDTFPDRVYHEDMNSRNAYALHYNRNAGDFAIYDSRAGHTARYAPLCKIRGMKEVTANKDEVTCGACRTALAK